MRLLFLLMPLLAPITANQTHPTIFLVKVPGHTILVFFLEMVNSDLISAARLFITNHLRPQKYMAREHFMARLNPFIVDLFGLKRMLRTQMDIKKKRHFFWEIILKLQQSLIWRFITTMFAAAMALQPPMLTKKNFSILLQEG